jgi:hypothetical protein
MEEKASQKEAAEKDKKSQRQEAELTKVKRVEERAQLQVQKITCQSNRLPVEHSSSTSQQRL